MEMHLKLGQILNKYRVAIALFFSFIWLLPYRFCAVPTRGIDACWKLSLNWNISQNVVFGKDFVFTYGPLGYLVTRWPLYLSPVPIIAFNLFLVFSFLLMLYQLFGSTKSWITTGYIFLSIMFAGKFLHYDASLWVLFFCVFYLLMYNKYKKWPLLLVAIFIATLNLYIKLNSGFISLFCVVSFLALEVITKRLTWYSMMAIAGGILFAVVGLNAYFNVWFPGYVKGSLEIINGYTESMATPISFDWVLWGGIGVILTILGHGMLRLKSNFNLTHLFFYGLFAGMAYLFFKQGFVRAQDHELWYFTIMPFCSLVLFWLLDNYTLSKKSQLVFGAVASICFICCLPFWEYGYMPYNPYKTFTVLQDRDPNNGKGSLHHEKLNSIVGQQSVDIFTDETDTYFRGNLHYKSRPICQTYSSFTKYLDSLNAQFFSDTDAPEFVLYCNKTIDQRNAGWEEAYTKIALLSHYQYIDTLLLPSKNADNPPDTFVIMQKRKAPLVPTFSILTDTLLQLNTKISIPPSLGFIIARIHIDYTFGGTLQKTLYHPNLPLIAVVDSIGRSKSYRQPLPIINSGFIVNKDFESQEDVIKFFKRSPDGLSQPKYFTFLSDDGNFKTNYRLTLTEVILQ